MSTYVLSVMTNISLFLIGRVVISIKPILGCQSCNQHQFILGCQSCANLITNISSSLGANLVINISSSLGANLMTNINLSLGANLVINIISSFVLDVASNMFMPMARDHLNHTPSRDLSKSSRTSSAVS